MHDPGVQGAGRTFRDQVDDPDTELSHHRFSCVVEGRFQTQSRFSTPHAVGVDRRRARRLDICSAMA
jgi:hypothetical protein